MRSLAWSIHTRAVDCVVDTSEGLNDLLRKGEDEAFIGDVAGNSDDLNVWLEGQDVIFGAIKRVWIEIRDVEFGAVAFHEGFSNGGTDA